MLVASNNSHCTHKMTISISREDAQTINPLIGGDTRDTLCNLQALLEGQAALIANRSRGTQLDAEAVAQLLQVVNATLRYEEGVWRHALAA